MLALVQSSGLGSAFHASNTGRPCVAHVGNLRYQRAAFAVAQPDAVDVGEKQLIDSFASKGYSTIKELRDTYPAAWREMIKDVSRSRLNAPVDVNHKQDPSRHAKVLRRELLAAATSLPEAENFLKQQLGISDEQKVKISYSLAPTLNELDLVEECEVNERTLRGAPCHTWWAMPMDGLCPSCRRILPLAAMHVQPEHPIDGCTAPAQVPVTH